MSAESSSNGDSPNGRPTGGWGISGALGLGLAAVIVPSVLASMILPLVVSLGVGQNIQNFTSSLVVELLTIAAVVAIVYAYRLRLTDIGLGRLRLEHVGMALLGFAAYALLSVGISSLMQRVMPFDENEIQDVGFTSPQGIELALVFLILVILVPLAEEILFRGFIFRGFRKRLPFWATALIVSVLFALAHFQINVGLDVFALSLVLCFLREKSDSLWPGIALHATKNFVAFMFLFVYGATGF